LKCRKSKNSQYTPPVERLLQFLSTGAKTQSTTGSFAISNTSKKIPASYSNTEVVLSEETKYKKLSTSDSNLSYLIDKT